MHILQNPRKNKMQKRIHQVFTCVRERTCTSYAKIATIGGLCDMDLIITKATAHDDSALPEKYVHDLLNLFNISPPTYSAFALTFARRFRTTRSWRVALKCLLLLHRLLRSLPDDRPLKAELLRARTTGGLSLYPCTFRDRTSSASDDYTAFVRAYARLLDEALDEHAFVSTNGDEAEELVTTIEAMPEVQSLIDRAMDCWPAGAASRSFLVRSAMKHVIRDSIWRYAVFAAEMEKVLENLIRMPYRSCVAALGIYRKAAVQAEELSRFYDWCKGMGYCGSYEYPYIDRIPAIQIRALEDFLDGMWQLTDPSSGGGELEEVEPLIKWGDDQEIGAGWEELLEASINSSNACWGQKEFYSPYDFQTPNPFNSSIMNYGSCPNTPLQNHHLWLEEAHHAYTTCT